MLQERRAAATSRPRGLLGVCRLRPHTAAERSRPVSPAGPTSWQPTLPVQPLPVGTPEDGAKQGDRCPLSFNSVSSQGPELSPGLEGAPSSLPPRPPGSAPPPSALQLHAQAPPSPQLHFESIWSLDFKRWSFVSRRARRSTQPELLGRERLPVMLTLRERGRLPAHPLSNLPAAGSLLHLGLRPSRLCLSTHPSVSFQAAVQSTLYSREVFWNYLNTFRDYLYFTFHSSNRYLLSAYYIPGIVNMLERRQQSQ